MNENEKKQHGGFRPGAGRKTKYEKTKVLRVPEQYLDVIKKLIIHLDNTAHIDYKNFETIESKSVYIRSLQDKKQDITFKTIPKK